MSQWEVIEKRFDELEKRINEIDKRLTKEIMTRTLITKQLTNAINVTRKEGLLINRYRFLCSNIEMMTKETVIEWLEFLFKEEKKLIEEFSEDLDVLIPSARVRIGATLPLSVTRHRITFDEFAEMLFQNLGIELAKELVPLEDIIKLFGSEYVTRWRAF